MVSGGGCLNERKLIKVGNVAHLVETDHIAGVIGFDQVAAGPKRLNPPADVFNPSGVTGGE